MPSTATPTSPLPAPAHRRPPRACTRYTTPRRPARTPTTRNEWTSWPTGAEPSQQDCNASCRRYRPVRGGVRSLRLQHRRPTGTASPSSVERSAPCVRSPRSAAVTPCGSAPSPLAGLVGRSRHRRILERTVNGGPGLVAEQEGVTVTVWRLRSTANGSSTSGPCATPTNSNPGQQDDAQRCRPRFRGCTASPGRSAAARGRRRRHLEQVGGRAHPGMAGSRASRPCSASASGGGAEWSAARP